MFNNRLGKNPNKPDLISLDNHKENFRYRKIKSTSPKTQGKRKCF